MEELESICSAISYEMGEWPTVHETVERYLNHLFFTIGNGIEIDDKTSSPLICRYSPCPMHVIPIHKFPAFDREAMQLANKERWLQDIQGRLDTRLKVVHRLYTKLGKPHPDGLETDEGKVAYVERELAKHTYPVITADNLTRDSIYGQISGYIHHPRRKALIEEFVKMEVSRRKISEFFNKSEGDGVMADLVKIKEDNECMYVRPYPLSSSYSNVYEITEKSPRGLIWVAKEFCYAWFNYLTDGLREGDFYKGPEESYAGEEWTRKHCEAIRELAHQFDSWLVNEVIP